LILKRLPQLSEGRLEIGRTLPLITFDEVREPSLVHQSPENRRYLVIGSIGQEEGSRQLAILEIGREAISRLMARISLTVVPDILDDFTYIRDQLSDKHIEARAIKVAHEKKITRFQLIALRRYSLIGEVVDDDEASHMDDIDAG